MLEFDWPTFILNLTDDFAAFERQFFMLSALVGGLLSPLSLWGYLSRKKNPYKEDLGIGGLAGQQIFCAFLIFPMIYLDAGVVSFHGESVSASVGDYTNGIASMSQDDALVAAFYSALVLLGYFFAMSSAWSGYSAAGEANDQKKKDLWLRCWFKYVGAVLCISMEPLIEMFKAGYVTPAMVSVEFDIAKEFLVRFV